MRRELARAAPPKKPPRIWAGGCDGSMCCGRICGRSADGARALRLLREHVFPAPAYILNYYGRRQPLLLPALYLHRILRGAGSWFRPIR